MSQSEFNKYNNSIVYIPAYKCASQIESVLERLHPEVKKNAKAILVVDNSSADATEEIVIKYREKNSLNNLFAFKLKENVGYGGSQKIAYRFAVENGADAIVMVHGDGQYEPELAPSIIDPILQGRAQLVFGSRIAGSPLKGGMPLHRYLGNRALTLFQNLMLGASLTEYHSGYRAYSVQALKKVNFEMMSDDYHFDTEMIIQFLAHKFKIVETVIPTHYGDEPNHVNIWKYGIDVVVTTLTYVFHKLGIRHSANWARIVSGSTQTQREEFLAGFLPACRLNGETYQNSSLAVTTNSK